MSKIVCPNCGNEEDLLTDWLIEHGDWMTNCLKCGMMYNTLRNSKKFKEE